MAKINKIYKLVNLKIYNERDCIYYIEQINK